MKLVFFDVHSRDEAFFRGEFRKYNPKIYTSGLNEASILDVNEEEIICCNNDSTLNEFVLSKLPRLKLIVTRCTGYDHIDIEYCKKKGITVCNIPEYGKYTVAEQTMALILSISRKITQSIERTRQGNFSLSGLTGFDLYGKTLGVVGCGSIGQEVIKRAKSFGMKIIVYTSTQNEELSKQLEFSFVNLDQLLSSADIVSFHLPYNKSTHHIINKNNIKKFKKGSILINTSRGGIIETEALVEGVEEGILGVVGLDVLEVESAIMDDTGKSAEKLLEAGDLRTQLLNYILLRKENVFITPHNGGNSFEAHQRILDTTVETILCFVDNRKINVVV